MRANADRAPRMPAYAFTDLRLQTARTYGIAIALGAARSTVDPGPFARDRLVLIGA
jgi:hypothetical protein